MNADPIMRNANLGRYTNFVNLLGCCAILVPARRLFLTGFAKPTFQISRPLRRQRNTGNSRRMRAGKLLTPAGPCRTHTKHLQSGESPALSAEVQAREK